MNQNGGFHIVANVLDVQLKLPVAITPKLRLEKANDYQVEEIRKHLEVMKGFGFPISAYEYYQDDSSQYQPLPREDWRYYILSYDDHGMEVNAFLLGANLVQPALYAFAFFTTEHPFRADNRQRWRPSSSCNKYTQAF